MFRAALAPELIDACLDRCRNAKRPERERYMDETLAFVQQWATYPDLIRAITASGMVPSTMVGRIRWLNADRNAPSWPERSESISMKPVTGGKK